MPWWAWLLIGLTALAAAGAWGVVVVRRDPLGRAFLKLGLRAKARAARSLLRSGRTPWLAKAVVAAVVVYLAIPFDVIPDFIPILGQLDDVLVVAGAFALLLKLIPREELRRAIDEADPPDSG